MILTPLVICFFLNSGIFCTISSFWTNNLLIKIGIWSARIVSPSSTPYNPYIRTTASQKLHFSNWYHRHTPYQILLGSEHRAKPTLSETNFKNLSRKTLSIYNSCPGLLQRFEWHFEPTAWHFEPTANYFIHQINYFSKNTRKLRIRILSAIHRIFLSLHIAWSFFASGGTSSNKIRSFAGQICFTSACKLETKTWFSETLFEIAKHVMVTQLLTKWKKSQSVDVSSVEIMSEIQSKHLGELSLAISLM